MLALLLAAAATACPIELVSGADGEGHVMFHGLSPDGRELAVGWEKGEGAARKRGAFILNLKTGKRTELPHLNNAASFSPDGRYLVAANFSGDPKLRTEIVELDRKTGRARTYASDPAMEWLASYSSDGKWILFNSMRTGASDLYRVDRASGRLDQITSDPRYEAHAQHIGRSGDLLFHRQTKGDDYDVVVRDARDGTVRPIGATPLEEAYPAASPDRRWIAFSAAAAAKARPNLFVMKPDGSGRRQLTVGPAKDAYATWSPDGRWIYFVRFEADRSAIMRLPMRGGVCRKG